MAFPIKYIAPTATFIIVIKTRMYLIMPLTITLKTPLDFISSLSFTSQSPIFAVTLNIPPPRISTSPNKGDMPLITAVIYCFKISKIANNPLNVLFILSAVSSLTFNFFSKC